ncbi:hypothetical protein EWM64_g8654 [Hericium alpestre]|uniref:Uncharacterized protein n=1 Tax=Hericium alpestre TaxID=135208 RepID=A0A4Y9ZPB4_9AGAM|nr:hypothetical protein EWM64_g8654 [Hericium alpestre]
MHTHISKSLKTRCRAIQMALRQFNTASRKIGCEELDWDDVSKYGSIAEFELLRECRVDIHSQPWADALNHQAANYMLWIECAEEEHQQLNVEVSCLAAWIHDEDNDIVDAVRHLESEGDCLLAAKLRVFGTHHRVSIALERQGEDAMELDDPPIELDADAHTREDEEDGLDAAEDDDIAEQLYALSSFMEDLALVTEPGKMAF